jgi:3-oxoacyl-[acyl-carrier-protein] synthase III
MAAITGVYTTVQGKKLGRTEESLKLEAVKGALAESGLSFSDVDGIVPMESSMHGPGLAYHMQWAEQLGGRPLGFMGIGQASAHCMW